MEMEQWWIRNKHLIDGDIVRGGYTKDEIEDLTGCIPLLLEKCAVNGKIDLNVEDMKSVWKEVTLFTSKVKLKAFGAFEENWEKYATLLKLEFR